MKNVKHDIQKVEQDTSQSMQTLLQLDTIKGRMEETSEALQVSTYFCFTWIAPLARFIQGTFINFIDKKSLYGATLNLIDRGSSQLDNSRRPLGYPRSLEMTTGW